MDDAGNFAESSECKAVLRGELDDSGSIKDIFSGFGNNIIKVMREEDFDKEVYERLRDSSWVADAEVKKRDWSDIDYWENTVVINQKKADFELRGAIDEYGAGRVIEMAVNDLLDNFTEEGIVYKDPKDNVGFFDDQPKAFDVYDTSAFILFDGTPEEFSPMEKYRFEGAAANMYKQFAEDIENKSTMDLEMAMNKVAEESDYLSDNHLDDLSHFQDSFDY